MQHRMWRPLVIYVLMLCLLAGCAPGTAPDRESEGTGQSAGTPDTGAPEPPESAGGSMSDETTNTPGGPGTSGEQETPDEPDGPDDPGASDTVTIACVGDSITEGVGVNDPAVSSYPARMAEALGENYRVLNYGKSGATLCSSSVKLYESKSWIHQSGYYEELMENAAGIDVVLILLGTNDGNSSVEQIGEMLSSNPEAIRADYEANLIQLVNGLRMQNPDIVIYLMSSPKCFRTGNTWEQTLADVFRPMQAELAEQLDLEWYDMYRFTSEVVGQRGFPDNLHPGELGYRLIGRELARVIAERYGTELVPENPSEALFSVNETFESVPDGSVWKDVNLGQITVGSSTLRLKAIEGSTLTAEDGVLALTRAGSDAYYDVMLEQSIYQGSYTFEIDVKASEQFDARGCFFFVFGMQFARFDVRGNITSVDGTKVFGQLTSDRFQTLSLTVDTEKQTYSLAIDGEVVDAGGFVFKETAEFRPLQFFASGNCTLYLDGYRVTQLS